MATADRFDTKHPPARVSSEILDRLPPQNLDAELGVLGSLLHDPQMCDEVVLALRADDFYADANQKLFRQIIALHDEGKRIDITLLAERLQKAGELEAVGGKAYLAEVLQSVPYAANVMHYAEIVRRKGDPPRLDPREHGDPPRGLGPGDGRSRRGQPGGGEDLRRTRPPQQRPGDRISTTCWSRPSTGSTPEWTARAAAFPRDSATWTT